MSVGADKEVQKPKEGPRRESQRPQGSRGAGPRSGRRATRRSGAAQTPPYQAAQIILLRLDGERGGPGQRPAIEVDAAAQVEVLGSADRGWRSQGAGIRDLGHGCGRSAARQPAP